MGLHMPISPGSLLSLGKSHKKLTLLLITFLVLTSAGISVKALEPESNPSSDTHRREAPNEEIEAFLDKTINKDSIEAKSDNTTTPPKNSQNYSSTTVKVNGRDISVSSEDGDIDKTFTSSDGSTKVDISIQSSSTSGGDTAGGSVD